MLIRERSLEGFRGETETHREMESNSGREINSRTERKRRKKIQREQFRHRER